MRDLYELTLNDLIYFEIDEKVEIKKERLTPKYCGFAALLYWNIITLGRVRVYSLWKDGKLAHTSYVVPKCFKFPFLRGGPCRDIEIGPCYTVKEYRGRGYYPYVLSHIIKNELSGGQKAYMIVGEHVIASQRGIKKVGFQKTGHIKKDFLKRYVITK